MPRLSWEVLFHGVEVAINIVVAIYVIPAAKRVIEVLRYYPPHRHTNGSIEYPPGMSPGRSERL